MEDKQIIIEDCPYFIGGNCQEYLDGVCENHKCDLKIIRELEQKLKAKEQECEELKKFQKLLEEQMKFNKSELELSLSSEIKRSEILLKEFKKVDKQRDTWREKAEKYFKTLTEIKEIAEKFCSESCPYKDDDCDICVEDCLLDEIVNPILQKISEVEDGNF